MPEKSKVPSMRFKGFTDEWEHCKLGECFYERQERSEIGELISVTKNDGIKKFDELGRHDNSSDDKSKYKSVQAGDIAYNSMRMWQGASGYSPYGGIVSPAYTVIIPKNKVDSMFFSFAFKRPQMIHIFQLRSQGITSDTWNLKFPAFSEIETVLPDLLEQRKISLFLKKIDNLITLQQKKHEKLKNIKKAMLEKMFPKEGSDVPEIRFAGFTNPWEKRKLGEITNVLSAARVHKEEWDSSGVPFFRSSDVVAAYKGNENVKAFISVELYEKLVRVSGKLEKDDILITGGGSIGIPYIVQNNKPLYSKDADLIWVKSSEKFNSRYLYTYFTSSEFRKYLSSISHIGTIAHYTIEQVKETPICLPSIDEQSKISSYFTRFDNLITLQQNKIEKLENIKKAFLEKMFV